MGRKLLAIFIGIVFVAGFGILIYPTVSDQWNTYRQSRLISNYESVLQEQMTEEDFTAAWEAARNYNLNFGVNNAYGDVFEEKEETESEGQINSQLLLADTEYGHVLNVTGDGIMGYIMIPKINVKLAIYHGVADDILQTGVGHMSGTALPIGGESTHTVLAAHRGLPSARLFTDVDQLMQGDMIYLKVLDETLAYEVNAIAPMVEKDDQETLEQLLATRPGEDLVTLFTCTPYGVNSHRLLVTGHRVPYNGELEETAGVVNTMAQAVKNYYMLYMLLGFAVTGLVILVLKFLFRPRKRSGDS